MTRKEYRKKHYQEHREEYIKNASEWNKKNKSARKQIVDRHNKRNAIKKRIWKEQKTFDSKATIIGKVCERCESDYRLAIHHRDGNNGKNNKTMNNDSKNLIVLCVRCHSSIHGWWGLKPI